MIILYYDILKDETKIFSNSEELRKDVMDLQLECKEIIKNI